MKKGFTLIELLVAVAIIGVLAAVGIISFNKFIESSKIAATNTQRVYSLKLGIDFDKFLGWIFSC